MFSGHSKFDEIDDHTHFVAKDFKIPVKKVAKVEVVQSNIADELTEFVDEKHVSYDSDSDVETDVCGSCDKRKYQTAEEVIDEVVDKVAHNESLDNASEDFVDGLTSMPENVRKFFENLAV